MTITTLRELRVGELVELVDVVLGDHDVDGGEHEWKRLLVGSYR